MDERIWIYPYRTSQPLLHNNDHHTFDDASLVDICLNLKQALDDSKADSPHSQKTPIASRTYNCPSTGPSYQMSGKKVRPKEKGLRKLSQRAYDIVMAMKSATYKEVANRLVDELQDEQQLTEGKDEQNIKRRVYDALNVLIALGVLRKDGRKIVGETSDNSIDTLRLQLYNRENYIERKRKECRQLAERAQLLSWLSKRNQDAAGQKEEVIQLPFTVVHLSSMEIETLNRNAHTYEDSYRDTQFIKMLEQIEKSS